MITGAVKMQNVMRMITLLRSFWKRDDMMPAQGQMGGASSNQPMLYDLLESWGMFVHYH